MRSFILSLLVLMCTVGAMAWETTFPVKNTGELSVTEFSKSISTTTRLSNVNDVFASNSSGSVKIKVGWLGNAVTYVENAAVGNVMQANGFVVGLMNLSGVPSFDKISRLYPLPVSVSAPVESRAYIKRIDVGYVKPEGSSDMIVGPDDCECYTYSETIDGVVRYHTVIEPEQPVVTLEMSYRGDDSFSTDESKLVKMIYESMPLNYKGQETTATGSFCLVQSVSIDYVLVGDRVDLVAEYYRVHQSAKLANTESALDQLRQIFNANTTLATELYAQTCNPADVNADGNMNSADVVSVYNAIVDGGSSGTFLGHEYVDLDLPSGTLWATCDLGAPLPEAQGDIFGWGELWTVGSFFTHKNTFTADTYLPALMSTNDKDTGELTYSETPMADSAPYHDSWGAARDNGWLVASKEQYDELRNNCTVTATTRNGVDGYLYEAKNGKSVFFPATLYNEDGWQNDGQVIRWTSTARPSRYAVVMHNGRTLYSKTRIFGYPIRCVVMKQNIK